MIDPLGGGFPLSPARSARPAATIPAPVAGAPGVKPDLSTLAAVARDLAAAPPVDGAKVDRIRQAIAAGGYAVDPAAIAAKMIALDLPRHD